MKNTRILRLALVFLLSISYWSCSQKNAEEEISSIFGAELQDFMLDFIEETNVPGMGFAFYSDSQVLFTPSKAPPNFSFQF